MSLYCVSFLLCFKCFSTDVENYMNVIILLQLMIFIQISNNLDTRVEAKSLRPNDSFILCFFFFFPFFLMILGRFLLLPFNFCLDNSFQQFLQTGCGGDTFLSFPLSQNVLMSPAFLSDVSLE